MHIQHTVQKVQNNEGFQELAPKTRTDLIIDLVEASRIPGTAWKRFAIDQAKEALGDEYLQSCNTQRVKEPYSVR